MISIQSCRQTVFVLAVLFCSLSGVASGQDDTTKTELGLRQQLLQMKMVEVEQKFRVIADRLQADQPEQAKLLIQAYQKSKEGLITSKMAEVTALLNENRIDEARKLHLEIRDGLDELVRLLTRRKKPTISKQQEVAQLQKFKSEIEKQLRQQKQLTSEAHKASNKEETVQKLEKKIKDLDELAKKQKELMDATKKNKKPSLRELDANADRQFEIRKQTERLKNELKELGGKPSDGESPDSDKKPGEKGEATDGKPEESSGQPGENGSPEKDPSGDPKSDKPENKPNDKSDPQGQPSGDSKPEDKPGDKSDSKGQPKPDSQGQPSGGAKPESKPGEKSDSQGQKGQKGDQQAPQPGQQALAEAQKEQAKAEEKLGSAKPEDAAKHQKEAIKNINKAKAEVEKEKRRIESLPEEVFDKLADDQRRLRDKALELAAEIAKAQKSKPDSGNEQSESKEPPNAGEQAMKEAGDAQQQAADAIKSDDPEQAKEKQKQAQRKMKKAIDEIEKRLAQLKDKTREEKLARLESRFKEMFDRQQETSVMTVEIQDRRSVLEGLQHRDRLVLMRLANNEEEINESAQQAYDLLLEDGTSVVFPEVVADLQEQLSNAMELLTDEKTGVYTQLVQKEIEATIQDLVDALKKAKDDGKKDGGGGGGGEDGGGEQPEQPLLKKSAELKVLRLQQLRLNRRTQNIEKLKGQPGIDDGVVSKEIEAAAQLQQKLVEMTDQIIE